MRQEGRELRQKNNVKKKGNKQAREVKRIFGDTNKAQKNNEKREKGKEDRQTESRHSPKDIAHIFHNIPRVERSKQRMKEGTCASRCRNGSCSYEG